MNVSMSKKRLDICNRKSLDMKEGVCVKVSIGFGFFIVPSSSYSRDRKRTDRHRLVCFDRCGSFSGGRKHHGRCGSPSSWPGTMAKKSDDDW